MGYTILDVPEGRTLLKVIGSLLLYENSPSIFLKLNPVASYDS